MQAPEQDHARPKPKTGREDPRHRHRMLVESRIGEEQLALHEVEALDAVAAIAEVASCYDGFSATSPPISRIMFSAWPADGSDIPYPCSRCPGGRPRTLMMDGDEPVVLCDACVEAGRDRYRPVDWDELAARTRPGA